MRIIDLYCGAGGSAVGLHRVFPDARIVGYDIVDQPSYPFEFVRQDALTVDVAGADFIWASPPCQRYSKATYRSRRQDHSDHIGATRALLVASCMPYVIENVDGAPLRRDVTLCGPMVGLTRIYRHRHFECSFPVVQPVHAPHYKYVGWGEGDMITVAGHGALCPSDVYTWQDVMGIDWMWTRDELGEAVPPAYSEYIARHVPTP